MVQFITFHITREFYPRPIVLLTSMSLLFRQIKAPLIKDQKKYREKMKPESSRRSLYWTNLNESEKINWIDFTCRHTITCKCKSEKFPILFKPSINLSSNTQKLIDQKLKFKAHTSRLYQNTNLYLMSIFIKDRNTPKRIRLDRIKVRN